MLPSHILEIVSNHLDAADRARFSCVCKATRDVGLRQERIRAVIPSTKNSVLSFSKWLSKRLRYVTHLEMVVDMGLWSYVWRYCGVKIALKLISVHLYHMGSAPFIIHSPEDVIPTAPFLEHLMVCAGSDVHLGSGVSRLRLKYLTIHSNSCVTSDLITFCIPTLEKLYIHGNMSNINFTSMYAMVSCLKLRHLECPAVLLGSTLPFLESLEYLILHGTFLYMPRHQPILKSPLKFVRLVQGHWCDLSWLPSTVTTLECVSCSRINKIPSGIKNLLLLSNRLCASTASEISEMHLDMFTFRSFGLCNPLISVHARAINVLEEDMCYIHLQPIVHRVKEMTL